MDAATYQRFTNELTAWAGAHPDVLGLVAVGSMAATTHAPDEWSDHDLWVIATPEAAPAIRDDKSWLPDADRIVLFYPETEHGRNAIYDDGHLVEHAVFADHELEVAKANAYRVLVDKTDITPRMEAIAAATVGAVTPEPATTWGRLLGNLVIGVSRYGRGELLSASSQVRGPALTHLLTLIRDSRAAADGSLDSLDPHRRVEQVVPAVAARLDAAMRLAVPAAAREMLAIAEQELVDWEGYRPAAVEAVRSLIDRAEEAPRPPNQTRSVTDSAPSQTDG